MKKSCGFFYVDVEGVCGEFSGFAGCWVGCGWDFWEFLFGIMWAPYDSISGTLCF